MLNKNWRLINSLWILITLIPYIYWMAFIYIGFTTKYRKWKLYGVIYLIPFLLATITFNYANGSTIYNIFMGIWIISWFVSIVHAFLLRKEYLIRLETVKKIQPEDNTELRRKIEKEYGLNEQDTFPKKLKLSSNVTSSPKDIDESMEYGQSTQPSSIIDVNNASEETLSELPGVSLILAKKVVQLRNSGVYFESAEDFGEALGLKPHIITRIKPLIVVTPHKETPMHKRRRIDI